MNTLLLDRSIGVLSPQALSRIHTTSLIHSVGHAPALRFDGGESAPVLDDDELEASTSQASTGGQQIEKKIWAHQTGVNSLAVDRFDGRWYESGLEWFVEFC
jgi:DNA excision repair protein ERCC-8